MFFLLSVELLFTLWVPAGNSYDCVILALRHLNAKQTNERGKILSGLKKDKIQIAFLQESQFRQNSLQTCLCTCMFPQVVSGYRPIFKILTREF